MTANLIAQAQALIQSHAPARPGIASAASRRITELSLRLQSVDANPQTPRQAAQAAMLMAQLQHIVLELGSLPVVIISPRVTP
jgi:hypothetical protein